MYQSPETRLISYLSPKTLICAVKYSPLDRISSIRKFPTDTIYIGLSTGNQWIGVGEVTCSTSRDWVLTTDMLLIDVETSGKMGSSD